MDERNHQELLMLYQVTVNDLFYFKTQQWVVSTYAFLLYAGLIGLNQSINTTTTIFEACILSVMVFGVFATAAIVLHKLQQSIDVRQARIERTRSHFSPQFQSAWAAKEKGKEYVRSIWFLNTAILVGASSVIYIIWR